MPPKTQAGKDLSAGKSHAQPSLSGQRSEEAGAGKAGVNLGTQRLRKLRGLSGSGLAERMVRYNKLPDRLVRSLRQNSPG